MDEEARNKIYDPAELGHAEPAKPITDHPELLKKMQESAARALKLERAMRGIEDPAAFMDEVRGVLGPLAAYGKVLRGQLVQADATVIELWDHKITVGQLIAVADLLDKIGGGE
jgi:hypothetical protein